MLIRALLQQFRAIYIIIRNIWILFKSKQLNRIYKIPINKIYPIRFEYLFIFWISIINFNLFYNEQHIKWPRKFKLKLSLRKLSPRRLSPPRKPLPSRRLLLRKLLPSRKPPSEKLLRKLLRRLPPLRKPPRKLPPKKNEWFS